MKIILGNYFFVFHDQPTYKLKRIEVDPGGRLSYQYHHKSSEAWTIVEGVGTITLDRDIKNYSKGETVLIPQAVKHLIEVQTQVPTSEKMI